tara:strand:+ start:160 stop:312 length:153 start_codon:yes stop_codon:yes gene_type:complete
MILSAGQPAQTKFGLQPFQGQIFGELKTRKATGRNKADPVAQTTAEEPRV